VLLAQGVEDPHGHGLDRLNTTVSEKHHAQVCPLQVLGVRWHGHGRAGVGNTRVPKGDHLVQRRRSVANLTENLPQNAGKILLVKGLGTNGTVRVDLVGRWLRHLYKNRDYKLDIGLILT
jgi:hypothetical protein